MSAHDLLSLQQESLELFCEVYYRICLPIDLPWEAMTCLASLCGRTLNEPFGY